MAAASALLAALSPGQSPVTAYTLPTPHPGPSSTQTPRPPSNTLPAYSLLSIVLDSTLSSGSAKANDIVMAHLQDPIVLNGQTVAAAGAPVRIRVLDARAAENPDIYGSVDIYYYPLQLANGTLLPIRPLTSHLVMSVSAGHESTVEAENTVGDIFAPTMLLHIFRKGHNFVLDPGAVIHARTQATVSVGPSGAVSLVTPAPMVIDAQVPHSSFNAMPLTTPSGGSGPLAEPSINPYTPGPSHTP